MQYCHSNWNSIENYIIMQICTTGQNISMCTASVHVILTFISWSWASLVARSDRRWLRSCALVSMPFSQLSRRWNFCSICRSLARALLSWARVSASRAWYNRHSCCRVSSARSSIWGRPQGMTTSRLTNRVLSKAWPSVQCSCSSCSWHRCGWAPAALYTFR